MKLLKTFNLNAKKSLISVSIIIVLLWTVPYFLPSDPETIINPAGWGFFAVFIWGIYCAFAATEYRPLRGLGLPSAKWLTSMHATLWVAALVFGTIAWLTYYAALRAGVAMYSSWVIAPGNIDAAPIFARIATFGSFTCGHLMTGYIGTLIGLTFSSASSHSWASRLLIIAGIIAGIVLVDFALTLIFQYVGAPEIDAPWPGLFFFTGLSIIVCSIVAYLLARRIQP